MKPTASPLPTTANSAAKPSFLWLDEINDPFQGMIILSMLGVSALF
jgi:hypothetical protein